MGNYLAKNGLNESMVISVSYLYDSVHDWGIFNHEKEKAVQ